MKSALRNRMILLTFLLLDFLFINAQTPSWVDFENRRQNYPADLYLTGFSAAKRDASMTTEEQFRILTDFARAEIVESISVTVTSQSLLYAEETNNTYRENFTQTTVSFANAELTGLKSETWEDRKTKQLYAFVYVRISALRDFYQAMLNEKRDKVLGYLDEAEQYRNESNNDAALRVYRECLPLIAEIEGGASIVQALTRQAQQGDLRQLSARVRRGLEEVSNIVASNPADAASILADGIAANLKDKTVRVLVFPFTYQDSRIAEPFSGALLTQLKQKLTGKGVAITEASAGAEQAAAEAFLTGVYWVENDRLRLIGNLSTKDGNVIACAEALLSTDWFSKNNQSLLPEKFEEAGVRNKVFTKDEIIGGGLNLELWTNKGTENLLFAENDTYFYISGQITSAIFALFITWPTAQKYC